MVTLSCVNDEIAWNKNNCLSSIWLYGNEFNKYCSTPPRQMCTILFLEVDYKSDKAVHRRLKYVRELASTNRHHELLRIIFVACKFM